jgi:Ca2+-binding EF-hand superfamily protein
MTVQQFSRLDRNHDNIISRADLDVPAADRLQRLVLIVAGADTDGDGAVTFDELRAKVADLTEAEFGLLDRNGDGKLTSADLPKQVRDAREELRNILRRMGSNAKGGFSIDDILARIPELSRIELGQLDLNGDGSLSLDDLPQLPVPRTDRGRGQLLRSILNADWNMDGVIDQSELETVFPDAPAELLALIDANQDWALTRSEIMAILGKDVAGLRDLVKPWDVDADGRITATDIQSVVNSALRRHALSLPADVDGDGHVNAVDIQTVISGLLNN